jgi:hypothetical protein
MHCESLQIVIRALVVMLKAASFHYVSARAVFLVGPLPIQLGLQSMERYRILWPTLTVEDGALVPLATARAGLRCACLSLCV